jgi:hypothetical protein
MVLPANNAYRVTFAVNNYRVNKYASSGSNGLQMGGIVGFSVEALGTDGSISERFVKITPDSSCGGSPSCGTVPGGGCVCNY